MAPGRITFQEIVAWQEAIGIRLDPWEVLAIRKLSAEWCAQSDASADPLCPPPWKEPMSDDALKAVARSLRDSLSRMAS